jgi:hypothetical protein
LSFFISILTSDRSGKYLTIKPHTIPYIIPTAIDIGLNNKSWVTVSEKHKLSLGKDHNG